MSYTVRSYGFIAALVTPVPKKDRDELTEKLCDEDSSLNLVYNGELVYLDYNRNNFEEEDIYGLWIGNDLAGDPEDLLDEAEKYGLVIDETTVYPFNCIWYNGSDNPVDLLTKKRLLKKLGIT